MIQEIKYITTAARSTIIFNGQLIGEDTEMDGSLITKAHPGNDGERATLREIPRIGQRRSCPVQVMTFRGIESRSFLNLRT